MKTKTLGIFAHVDGEFVPAGKLDIVEEHSDVRASSFQYGSIYLARKGAIEIDPVSLPIQGALGRKLFPADGLALPGGIRDAAPDGWGRRVIEARLHAQPNSLPESTYLLYAGDSRAGALDVRESISSESRAQQHIKSHQLAYLLDAAGRIEAGEKIPAQLEDIFLAGTGSGGMRPKATVEDDGELWLAKFPSRNEVMDIPLIEAATMRLAALAGMNVPEIKVKRIGDRSVMMIKRFDRFNDDTGLPCRRHMVSALTMLGCHESESREKSYHDIAASIRRYSKVDDIKAGQAELFTRMVFNVMVTNDDDHLRNHAFLYTPGKGGGWGLSPLYDVMPRAAVSQERFLHLSIGKQGRLATLDNALSGYAGFGLTLGEARSVIDRVWTITREWKTYFSEFGVPDKEIDNISSAFRHIDEILSPKAGRAQQDIADIPPVPGQS